MIKEIINIFDYVKEYKEYIEIIREYKDIVVVINKVNNGDLTDEEVLESIKPDLELLNLKYN